MCSILSLQYSGKIAGNREETMQTRHVVVLSMLGGVAFGAIAVQGLHAQAKPRAYAVIEIDVRNQEGFNKEFVPLISKTITDQGGKYLARGGKIVGVAGRTPKRLTVVEFESLEKAQAVFASTAYKDARKIGNKYSKPTSIAVVEGVSQ
jgi:uncharacterized protein (DUF1330 family)